jgi:hypothetical protein
MDRFTSSPASYRRQPAQASVHQPAHTLASRQAARPLQRPNHIQLPKPPPHRNAMPVNSRGLSEAIPTDHTHNPTAPRSGAGPHPQQRSITANTPRTHTLTTLHVPTPPAARQASVARRASVWISDSGTACLWVPRHSVPSPSVSYTSLLPPAVTDREIARASGMRVQREMHHEAGSPNNEQAGRTPFRIM